MRLDWPHLQKRALTEGPTWEMGEILLDFQGPQIALWHAGGHKYLGVAADDDGAIVRWLAAPVSPHEIEALRIGSVALRDLLSQPEIHVFDQDGAGEISYFDTITPESLPELAMPAHGAPLPDEVTAEYRSRIASEGHLSPTIILDGNGGGKERSLRVLGEVLVPLQKLLDAIGQRIAAQATHRGVVPQEIRARTALSLASFTTASAVLAVTPADPDIFDDISERLLDLALSSGDDDALAQEIEHLGPRVRSAFGELITAASRYKVSVFARSRRGGAVFSRHTADRIRSALVSAPIIRVEEIELVGQFVAFDTRTRSFDFVEHGDLQPYRGSVASLLADNESVIVGKGATYRVWLQLQAMRRVGAQQSTEYQLNRIELCE